MFLLFLFTFSTYLVRSTLTTQTWPHSKSLPLKICSIGQLNVHVSPCGNYEAKWENNTINVFSCNIHPTIHFQYPLLQYPAVIGQRQGDTLGKVLRHEIQIIKMCNLKWYLIYFFLTLKTDTLLTRSHKPWAQIFFFIFSSGCWRHQNAILRR